MLNFLNFIPGWKSHGTKLVGAIVGVVGAIETLTPGQLAAFHIQPAWVATAVGILTFLRGFDNAAKKTDIQTNVKAPPSAGSTP